MTTRAAACELGFEGFNLLHRQRTTQVFQCTFSSLCCFFLNFLESQCDDIIMRNNEKSTRKIAKNLKQQKTHREELQHENNDFDSVCALFSPHFINHPALLELSNSGIFASSTIKAKVDA